MYKVLMTWHCNTYYLHCTILSHTTVLTNRHIWASRIWELDIFKLDCWYYVIRDNTFIWVYVNWRLLLNFKIYMKLCKIQKSLLILSLNNHHAFLSSSQPTLLIRSEITLKVLKATIVSSQKGMDWTAIDMPYISTKNICKINFKKGRG